MLELRSRVLLVLALAAAACGGSTPKGPSGTPITCAWLGGANCWKSSVAAATACTNELATGAFDAATTRCGYADGTSVQFDPGASATASYAAQRADGFGATWDFTVLTSTAATCAHLRRTGDGLTLTTRLGTFTMTASAVGLEFTCPDGSRYSLDGNEYLSNCLSAAPGYAVSRPGPMLFSLANGGTADLTLWRCQ